MLSAGSGFGCPIFALASWGGVVPILDDLVSWWVVLPFGRVRGLQVSWKSVVARPGIAHVFCAGSGMGNLAG